jgi:hypothetical protein
LKSKLPNCGYWQEERDGVVTKSTTAWEWLVAIVTLPCQWSGSTWTVLGKQLRKFVTFYIRPVANTKSSQNYRGSRLCPSSGIKKEQKTFRKLNVSVLRHREKYTYTVGSLRKS